MTTGTGTGTTCTFPVTLSSPGTQAPFKKQADATISLLEKRQKITEQLLQSPYNLILYLERASIHTALGYPDLGVGDSYRALLLCDECTSNGGFEYQELAWSALESYCTDENFPEILPAQTKDDQFNFEVADILLSSQHPLVENQSNPDIKEDFKYDSDTSCYENHIVLRAAYLASLQCYRNLSIGLLLCNCLKSAYDFCSRGLGLVPEDVELLQIKKVIESGVKTQGVNGVEKLEIDELPDEGWVRREVYPWNHYEPDRFSPISLDILNSQLAIVAPKCEVRATELLSLKKPTNFSGTQHTKLQRNALPISKQLGIFAKEDILPGEMILKELSVLAVNNRLKDSLCDACSAEIPLPCNTESTATSCLECDDILFCSNECKQRAELEYHPSVCGKDVETIGKDPPLKEKPNGLYFLLLCRAIAMASTQKVHPLNLTPIKYIWGDFLPVSEKNTLHSSFYTLTTLPHERSVDKSIYSLPFSFKYNVVEPLHVLEKMDIDIFASLEDYDLWVLNTLYCKFRGTASARMNKNSGHPEAAAIHPLWCLANHDCDPNVQWEWTGAVMRLWCRETRISDRDKSQPKCFGIKSSEEILNHYCDIELKVHERREWAEGSLGGLCQCARCLHEEKEEKLKTKHSVKEEAVLILH
ncbi:putative wd tetratricopeptide repeat domain-containing protein [Erysiphe neolycopersici]|uniref:Putative wd tetratricopeptide repeat domain-containing protein n=1 Tax=Erysiphe neolycopersici TaxID=212602 RepID=A0A420I834_9PEZI|nr:putative wd tetratricopeptide repeat domain-containing protein [Erysiphe neolycopersici]